MEEQRTIRRYKSKDERIEQIKEFISQGATSIDEIAAQCGLNVSTIRVYSSQYKIKLPKIKSKKDESISKIKEAIENGAISSDDIARDIGLTKKTILSYISRFKVEIPLIKERRLNKLKKMIAEGIGSLEELVDGLGISTFQIRVYCKDYNITLPTTLKEYPTRPEIDVLIQQGLRLKEIGIVANLTGERVRQYINASGQYKIWVEKKNKIETKRSISELKQPRIELVHILEEKIKQELPKQSLAYQRAFQYYKNIQLRKNGIKFEKIVELFELYEDIQNRGEKISLTQFKEKTGISSITISHIFKHLNLTPCYPYNGNQKRKHTGEYKKQVLQQSESIMMNDNDIAYFSEIANCVVTKYFNKINKNRKKEYLFIKQFSQGHALNYRLASQIYEAIDLSFNVEEISQLTDKTPKIIEYARKQRTTIETFILESLKTLYPDKEIKQAYKPFF